jgi:hypothetical protein
LALMRRRRRRGLDRQGQRQRGAAQASMMALEADRPLKWRETAIFTAIPL